MRISQIIKKYESQSIREQVVNSTETSHCIHKRDELNGSSTKVAAQNHQDIQIKDIQQNNRVYSSAVQIKSLSLLKNEALFSMLYRIMRKQLQVMPSSEARQVLKNADQYKDGQKHILYQGKKNYDGSYLESDGVNIEHGWALSRHGHNTSMENDLHHMFWADARINQERSSRWHSDNQSYSRASVYEPPEHSKGRLSRALMYVAIVYQQSVPDEIWNVWKQWNKKYPPDEAEIYRNQYIGKHQGNSNIFIESPFLADNLNSPTEKMWMRVYQNKSF